MTIHVELSPDLERLVNALVESGRYASMEEVVAAALEELALQEAAESNVPVARSDDDLRRLIDAPGAGSGAHDAEDVFARLRARLAAARP